MLTQLIKNEIDGKPVQKRLVSALLAGTNLAVPKGKDVGGAFRHIPLCRRATETGCAVAYVTFRANEPPTRTDSSGAAFKKLDPGGNGYITRSDFAKLRGGDFDAADTNHDGRLSYDEFQRYWTEVQSGKD